MKISKRCHWLVRREGKENTKQFMPHRPVMMFIGKTMVPMTVSFPRISFVLSARSFMRRLICAR